MASKTPPAEEGTPAYFVYAGRDGDQHLYYVLTNLQFNDGKIIARQQLDTFYTSKKIFKRNVIGFITPVTLKQQGKSVNYKPDTQPVAHWETMSDIAEWQLADSAAQTIASIKKQAGVNQLAKALEPIRLQYERAATKQTRTAMLAEVIRIITS